MNSEWTCSPAPSEWEAIKWAKANPRDHYWTMRDGAPYICWRVEVCGRCGESLDDGLCPPCVREVFGAPRDEPAPGFHAVEEERAS